MILYVVWEDIGQEISMTKQRNKPIIDCRTELGRRCSDKASTTASSTLMYQLYKGA